MKERVRNILIIVFGICLSFSLTGVSVNYVAKQTLYNTEWIFHQYETLDVYNHYSDAIDEFLNKLVYNTTGKKSSFKKILSEEEIITIVNLQTEQRIAIANNNIIMTSYNNMNIYNDRISEQLKVLNLTSQEEETIINGFIDEVGSNFFSLMTKPETRPDKVGIWNKLILSLSQKQVIIYFIFGAVISFMAMIWLCYKNFWEWLVNIVYSMLFESVLLIFPFVFAHNLYYDRSRESVGSIKLQLYFEIYNEVFTVLYTAGYYLLVFSLVSYSLIMVRKIYKNLIC